MLKFAGPEADALRAIPAGVILEDGVIVSPPHLEGMSLETYRTMLHQQGQPPQSAPPRFFAPPCWWAQQEAEEAAKADGEPAA